MIRDENEYKDAVRRLGEQEERLKQQAAQLKQTKLSKDAIKRVLDPVRCFHDQIKEEVAGYKRLKRGEFDELQNFAGIGRLLIALRIAKGLTQRELAERLELSETQVSRDERNEYHGVTVELANRILEALEVEVTSAVSSLGTTRRLAKKRPPQTSS
jgi:DNA-binding XRE family transcriptional regulator